MQVVDKNATSANKREMEEFALKGWPGVSYRTRRMLCIASGAHGCIVPGDMFSGFQRRYRYPIPSFSPGKYEGLSMATKSKMVKFKILIWGSVKHVSRLHFRQESKNDPGIFLTGSSRAKFGNRKMKKILVNNVKSGFFGH